MLLFPVPNALLANADAYPIAVLLEPVENIFPALEPIAILNAPDVLLDSAYEPIAILLDPALDAAKV